MKYKPFWLAFALLLLSAALIGYRVIRLHYPLLPDPKVKAWQFSMGIHIKPDSTQVPIKIQVGVPQNRVRQTVIGEQINSGPLDAGLFSEEGNHFIVWSGLLEREEDYLSYEATIVIRQRPVPPENPPQILPIPDQVIGEDRQLLQRMAEPWRTLKPDARLQAVISALGEVWVTGPPPPDDRAAWMAFQSAQGRKTALISLLRASGLPAHEVEGLIIMDESISSTVRWVVAWTGNTWVRIDPEKGRLIPLTEQMLPLVTGGLPLVRVEHAKIQDIRWTLVRQIVSPWRMHMEPVIHGDHFLNRWSLFSLPTDVQTIFRIILLVPIGALMICFLRNVIGFPMFGIFMPVLMALAFRTTGLLYGLLLFAGVVLIGYAIRRWISELRLLLVPRLATILTLVILCFSVLAIIGNKLELRNMMAVGLLPFVILTMTVERFYILIEESGAREALLTSLGSAVVAALTYVVLDIERLQLLFFVYPELLFAIAACQIMLGRYTGYRLSEFIRFRALRKET